MDQELQFLINTLYGNKLNEKQLAGIMQMAQLNPQYLLNMRNAANAKMPGSKLDMSNIRANNIASLRTPTLGRIDFNHFTANKGIAKNDMSAVDDFKLAFRQARLGGNKTFFWKKTKANPSGMFSTETKPQGYDGSVKVNNSKVFLDIDKTDIPAFTGLPVDQFDIISPRIPVQGPVLHERMDDPNFVPRIPVQGKTDLAIFSKQEPIGVSISGSNRIAGRKYGEGQQNANLYFGRKGMFANGGTVQNIEQQVTQLVQAAAGGDQKATQQIEQIMQAAQQGDLQAVQIAQIIQKVITAMQQQKGIKAALGAKLDYLRKIKGLCPEGTEKVYLAKGGCMCKQKATEGTKVEKKEKKMNEVQKFKSARPGGTLDEKKRTPMPTKYDDKKHEKLAIGEAMGKNTKAQQDSLQHYRKLYNKKSNQEKYNMGDLEAGLKLKNKKACGGLVKKNK